MAGDPRSRSGSWNSEVNLSKPIFRRPKALEDIEGAAIFLAEDNLEVALRFLDRAELTIKGISEFPESGAPFQTNIPDLAGLRTKLIKDFSNYVVFYLESSNAIEIVRVLRGGQDMSAEIG